MNKDDFSQKTTYSFQDLLGIVAILRSENGCSWDRAQTHKSIRNNFVEEVYELCEGIDTENMTLLCEELGDVLLHAVFHIQIAEENGEFTKEEVFSGICNKMIHRHPHVFSDSTSLPASWDEIKRKEKGEKKLSESLERISKSLPALMRAQKIIQKTKDLAINLPINSDESLLIGEKLYALCKECTEQNIDSEEALNAYLNKIIKDCTKYE